jgi:hypothetical protein
MIRAGIWKQVASMTQGLALMPGNGLSEAA